jgi:hypothetical protein
LVLIFFLRKKHDQPRAASMINRVRTTLPEVKTQDKGPRRSSAMLFLGRTRFSARLLRIGFAGSGAIEREAEPV